MLVDLHAHRFWDDPKLEQEEVANPDFDKDVADFEKIAAQITAANRAKREAKKAAALKAAEGGGGAEAPKPSAVPAAPEPPARPKRALAPKPLAHSGDEWETVADDHYS